MLYNQDTFLPYYKTAGKITILTAISAVVIFVFAFMLDVGTQELQKVSAQTATTSLTVLNTPPEFVVDAFELIESSTTTPTNSGDLVRWTALAEDANNSPYYLLICSTNAVPEADEVGQPSCGIGAVQWGVSTATPSGTYALVSTTTTEVAPFDQVNDWYAWVCDNDPNNPECNVTPVQGISATNSSPFVVNYRPQFSEIVISSSTLAANPGGTLFYYSSSTDSSTFNGDDNIFLAVCTDQTFSTTTRDCGLDTLATTSGSVKFDATATFSLPGIVQDDVYAAYVYVFDQYGHPALGGAQNTARDYTVNNVAPFANNSGITLLNGSSTIILTNAGGQTTGFALDFIINDNNSCLRSPGLGGGPEITNFVASVFRTSIGTTTCNGSAYDPNNCYGSLLPSSTWNLSCTASSTSCTHTDIAPDADVVYNCTFPLWFVADPTDNGTNTPAILEADTWSAAVTGIDDNSATGTLVATNAPVELQSFPAFSLLTNAIPYGELAPGTDTVTLRASTTIRNLGNTGLDQEVEGDSMCDGYTPSSPCPVSATSTIPESEQQFASSSLSYDSLLATTLSSTTANEVEIDVPKTVSTSTPNLGVTFFGIAVPTEITFSGIYTGLNTFYAATAEALDWDI